MKKNTDYPVSSLKRFLILIILAGAILGITFLPFKIYYKGFYNNEFIGYYQSKEEYLNHYEDIQKEKWEDGIKTINSFEKEPEFKKVYVKSKFVNSFNNYILIEQQLEKEYVIYSIKINDENKFYLKTKEEAEQLKTEIAKEVKDSTKIEIEEIKTKDKNLINNNETLNQTKAEVIKANYKITSRGGSSRTSNKYIWPTTSTTITSKYGYRTHPITGQYSLHTGLDIGVASNSPIFVVLSGTVTFSGWNGAYGYQVKVDHGNGLVTTYAHNNKLLVKAGDKVAQGQTIARSGSTGNSTGPHLHIEFIKNGQFQNPLNYL